MVEKVSQADSNNSGLPNVPAVAPTSDTPYIQPVIGKLGYDTEHPDIFGIGSSPDNGINFHVWASFKGLVLDKDDMEAIWIHGVSDRVKSEVNSATAEIPAVKSAADEAVEKADSAIASSKVNSDALVAQSNAISEAQSAMGSSIAEINQAIADASSNAAKIRADVDQVQNEVNSAKSANESTVAQIKSDISQTKDSLTAVNDKLTQAQSATNQAQSALREQVNQLSASVTANQSAITQAQTANDNVAKRLDVYASQASAQGETIKSVQSDVAGNTSTIADINSNVTQVQQTADNLSASLKNADSSIASVKAQADNLSATLSNQAKSIASVTATATQIKTSLSDATGRLSTLEQTSSSQSATLSDVQKNLNSVTATATMLTNTLSNAQGSINKLQASAKSTQEQISDLQGNYTALQTTVNGLSTTVSNHDKSIESLQVTANGLTNSVKDAQGNINSLQATAKTLNISMTDAQGRLSRVEQTATSNSSTISNLSNKAMQDRGSITDSKASFDNLTQPGTYSIKATGLANMPEAHYGTLIVSGSNGSGWISQQFVADTSGTIYTRIFANNAWSDWKQGGTQEAINQVKQTADANTATISDAKGDINSLKQTATSLQATLTNHGNDITQIKANANNLSSRIAGVESSTNTLKDQTEWKTNYGSVDLNNFKTPCHEFLKGPATNAPSESAWWYLTVEGSEGNRIIQTVIADQSNNRYTRRWADSWSAWVKDATQADVTTLSNRITTNSTQITQNKQAIALKADQSTVDNLSGEVSHNAAQLKVQADQISSKVSSEDFKTLDNKVGGAIAQIDKNTTAIDQTNKQISLKADQTEVDKIKNTATQNSSRLDVMAGEIKSKVDGTAVNNILDSKGYATMSYAQTLVKQTKDQWDVNATNLKTEIKDKDGINLLTGTADFSGSWFNRDDGSWTDDNWRDTNGNRVRKRAATAWYGLGQTVYLEPGNYTFSMDMFLNLGANDSLNFYADAQYNGTPNIVQLIDGNNYDHSSPQGSWFRAICHFKVTKAGNVAIRPELNHDSGTVHVGSYKLEKGLIATPWTPAPSDNASVTQISNLQVSIDGIQSTVTNKADKSQITQLSNVIQSKVGTADFNNLKRAVDMQTLDSADINNMKTNGHYFVHNLANNPVGGWVYVDVTGDGNERIRQDVYQDSGNKHKYRRWFGNSWTNWSEGASESEITQLRDDINLRVKSGDLLSQINLTAHNTLIQSNKIYLDSSSTVFSGKAFIPSAAITSLEADKVTTGTLNGVEIRQLETGGRSIDIKNGNIAITSHDPYESRISFTNDGKNIKMFNALGDLEVINQEFSLFNFTPEDTHSLNPIPFFKVTNTGQIGSGGAQLNMDHAIFDGYEWWTPSAGVTFGRTWNGVDKSSDYADIYAKSFVPHSELSAKTRIKKLDRKEALDKIMQDDMYTYQFKEDVRDGVSKRYASFIIDNIHDVAQYTEPEEFLSANGKGRDDGTQLAYLIAAVQYQQEQIEELKKKLEEK